MEEFTVLDVIRAEFLLEPIVCLFCGSHLVIYHQYINDGYCENCGKWQIG